MIRWSGTGDVILPQFHVFVVPARKIKSSAPVIWSMWQQFGREMVIANRIYLSRIVSSIGGNDKSTSTTESWTKHFPKASLFCLDQSNTTEAADSAPLICPTIDGVRTMNVHSCICEWHLAYYPFLPRRYQPGCIVSAFLLERWLALPVGILFLHFSFLNKHIFDSLSIFFALLCSCIYTIWISGFSIPNLPWGLLHCFSDLH